jgi:hypothetical protein
MATKNTNRFEAYGVGQPSYAVQSNPIISDRNPTVNDKANLGQLWVNPTANVVYILVAINGNQAIWATGANMVAGNFIAGGTVTGTMGLIALAGGVTSTGVSSFTGNTTFNGDIILNGALTAPATDITANNVYARNFSTITDPNDGLYMWKNYIGGEGANANIDVIVVPKGNGAFGIDGLAGGFLWSQWRINQAYLRTNDAVEHEIFELPLAETEMIVIEATINGLKSTWDHACSGKVIISAFRPNLGNVTELGNMTISSNVDAGATATVAITADVDVPTQTVNIYVTGAIGETWDWVTTVNYMYTSA